MPIAIISTLVSCAFVFIYAFTSRIFIKGKTFSTVLIVLLSVSTEKEDTHAGRSEGSHHSSGWPMPLSRRIFIAGFVFRFI